LRNTQTQRADLDLVTDDSTEAREQARLRPDFAALRHDVDGVRPSAEAIRHFDRAPQRVSGANAANVRERRRLAGNDDATETDDCGGLQSVPKRGRFELGRQRIDGLDAQVGGQGLARLLRGR
jgi:hypothetical protein